MTKVTVTKQTRSTFTPRTDRWVNERNRFGGSSDPVSRTTFFRDVALTRGFLEDLYQYEWLSRKAVDIPAADATREKLLLRHDNPKRVQDAERELGRLGVMKKIKEMIILARLYGGGVMLIGAWDGRDVTEPLGQVRQIFWLANVDRYLAYPLTFYRDKEDIKYGDPEHYQISRPLIQGSDVATVHETRIIRLDGNYLPPLRRIQNFSYGASVIENILEATRQFGICSQALAGVVQDFVTKKLKVGNLQQLLETPEGIQNLQTRVGELAASMSIYGIATFGPDEEFDKMGTPVTGLPDMADRFVEYASAATGIPRSRLFNNLSGRLGGDAGENDLRVHYDGIAAYQENDLRDPIQRLLDIVLMPIGFEPGEMQFEYAPLWQLSDSEQADVRLKTAQADEIYINAGVVQPEEVAMSRFAGDGVNLTDMHIETAPREKFLKEFAKSEPREFDPDDPDGTKAAAALQNADPNAKQNGKGTPPDPDADDFEKKGKKKDGTDAAAKH